MRTKMGQAGKPKPRTYFISSDEMMRHKCEWDDNHPETPARLEKLMQHIKKKDLLGECEILQPHLADVKEIQLVHSEKFVAQMASTQNLTTEELETVSSMFEDIFINNDTYACALLSAGCALEAVKALLKQRGRGSSLKYDSAFAAIRPPGHHSSKGYACGFCIFNNVAICARKARQLGAERVLIIDWDVHAPQGTQYCIKDDPNILLVSIHRFEYGGFWPHLPESGVVHEYKNTVNFPLNSTENGDAEYLAFMSYIVSPIIQDFRPSLVLISCGFDASLGDPLGEMKISPGGYQWMMHIVIEEAARVDAPVCALLEGGYFPEAVALDAEYCLRAMLSKPLPALNLPECNSDFLKTMQRVIVHYSQKFPSMAFFLKIAQEIRRYYGLEEICSSQLSNENEYEGEPPNVEFPFETRGNHSPVPKNVIRFYTKELEKIVNSYSYEENKPELIVNFFDDGSNYIEDEVMCNVELVSGADKSAVLNYYWNYVVCHSCEHCNRKIGIQCLENPLCESVKVDRAAREDATIRTICNGLREVFLREFCPELKKIILFTALS